MTRSDVGIISVDPRGEKEGWGEGKRWWKRKKKKRKEKREGGEKMVSDRCLSWGGRRRGDDEGRV